MSDIGFRCKASRSDGAHSVWDALLCANRGAREAALIGMGAAAVAYYAARWPLGIGKGVSSDGGR